ncbi:MAG: T9SS type A sorting domain-containing protein, partial [Lentimicrobium sp.]|nr:T9SS type A sorting domain-containing protein [Lentimicrobium sp.]
GLSSLTLNENFSVGIEELLKKETRIYPNPVMNNIFVDINLKNSGNMLAEAYNMNGQLAQVLFDGGLQSGKQTLSFKNDLNPGSYVLRMITPDGTLNRKLLVN